jgi:Tol biopolymer transport system component
MNADGTDPVQLTDFTGGPTPNNINLTKPTWSPKGDRIAFHRRVTLVDGTRGHTQVYTMNASGSDVKQITFTADPGFSGFPSWGKRGSE